MRFISLLIILFSTPLMAQQDYTLRGTVVDRADGSPVAFAELFSNGIVIAYSDIEGHFQCPLTPNKDSVLHIKALKYYAANFVVTSIADSVVLEMRPDSFGLGREIQFYGIPDTTFFENGNIESLSYPNEARKTFYEDGSLFALIDLDVSKLYYENGNLMEIRIQLTAHTILYTHWYENGQMAANGYHIYDMESSQWLQHEGWKEWKKNGKPKR